MLARQTRSMTPGSRFSLQPVANEGSFEWSQITRSPDFMAALAFRSRLNHPAAPPQLLPMRQSQSLPESAAAGNSGSLRLTYPKSLASAVPPAAADRAEHRTAAGVKES
jgi:hypothetical protein